MAEKTIRPEKVLRIIGLSLFGVAILLAFIGCFGDIFKGVTIQYVEGVSTTYTQTTSFTWLFKDMWKELAELKNQASYLYMYAASYPCQLILSLLCLISYIGCLGGVIAILVVALVKFVNGPNSDNIDIGKFSKLLTISVIPFLITVMMLRYSSSSTFSHGSTPSYSTSGSITYGWGTILLIVSAFVSIVASALSSTKDNASKNDIAYNILTRVSIFVLMFAVVFGFRGMITSNYQTPYENMESKLSILTLLRSCSQKYSYVDPTTGSTVTITAPGAYTSAIFAMIFLIAIVCLVVLTFKTKKISARITFLACILGLSIVVGVLCQTAAEQLLSAFKAPNETIKFGSGPLVMAILSGVSLIITCVSAKFAPNKQLAISNKK